MCGAGLNMISVSTYRRAIPLGPDNPTDLVARQEPTAAVYPEPLDRRTNQRSGC